MAPSQSRIAEMEQTAPNRIPILTPGDLTLKALQSFEMACRAYFSTKGILESEQVERITWGIQDPRMQDWYMTNQARIDAMSFCRYLVELKRVWLPSDWERTTRAKVLSTQQGDKKFWEWVVDLQGTNLLLQGTQSYLMEDTLLNQIEANRHLELSDICCNELVDEIEDFHLWLETVSRMDNRRIRELA